MRVGNRSILLDQWLKSVESAVLKCGLGIDSKTPPYDAVGILFGLRAFWRLDQREECRRSLAETASWDAVVAYGRASIRDPVWRATFETGCEDCQLAS